MTTSFDDGSAETDFTPSIFPTSFSITPLQCPQLISGTFTVMVGMFADGGGVQGSAQEGFRRSR
eukprot:CAMPEP_0180144590 /NCGR_PEP_ID=MMETSP0986-20121125/17036_1 /TAXON_ID=697907 /ORGANISM="non described non described, Strain CCMP2293" /LENGTH=63 /DNA_ID=CAMNT_0022088547 /DNA_START=375 /DNA_END=563 /DNA_ORIENTATION=-